MPKGIGYPGKGKGKGKKTRNGGSVMGRGKRK